MTMGDRVIQSKPRRKLTSASRQSKFEFPYKEVAHYWKWGKALSVAPSRSSKVEKSKILRSKESRQAVQFYRLYRNLRPWKTNLSWAHYQLLLATTDVSERSYYEHEAIRHGWSANRLGDALRRRDYQKHTGLGQSMILADAGRRGKAVGSLHNHVQVASQTSSYEKNPSYASVSS